MVLEILKMIIAIIYNELNQKYVFNRVAWVILVGGYNSGHHNQLFKNRFLTMF